MSSIVTTLVSTGRDQQPATTPVSNDAVPEFYEEVEISNEDSADSNLDSLSTVVVSCRDCIDLDESPMDQNSELNQDKNNNNTQLSCELLPLQVLNEKLQRVLPNLQIIQQEKVPEVDQEIEILADLSQNSRSGVTSITPVKKIQFDKQNRVSLMLSKTNVPSKSSNNPNFMLDTQSISKIQSRVHDLLPESQSTNSIDDPLSEVHILKARIQDKSISIKCLRPNCKAKRLKDNNPEHDCHINWFKLLEWQTVKKKHACSLCDERFEHEYDLNVHIEGHVNFNQNRLMNGNYDSDSDSVIEILLDDNANDTESGLVSENKPLQDLVPSTADDKISDCDSVIEILPEENGNHIKNSLTNENKPVLQNSVLPTTLCQNSEYNLVTEEKINYTENGLASENQSSVKDLLPPTVYDQNSDGDSVVEILPEENRNHTNNNMTRAIQPSSKELTTPALDCQISDSDSVIEILPENSNDDNLKRMTSCSLIEQIQLSNENSMHPVSNTSKTLSDRQNSLELTVKDLILQKYLASQSVLKIFICAHCDKRITSKSHLRVHVKKHMLVKIMNCSCPNCSAVGSNRIRDSRGRPLHLCDISDCRKTFSQINALKRHLERHCSEKNYFCAHCDERFQSKGLLTEHVQRHMNSNLHWTKNDNVDDHVSQEKGLIDEKNDDSVTNSLTCAIAPTVQDVASSSVNFELNRDEDNFFCEQCGTFERKDLITEHVYGHMISIHNGPKQNNDNSSQILKCCQQRETSTEVRADSIVDNMYCKTQPVQDTEGLECNSVTGGLAKVSTDNIVENTSCEIQPVQDLPSPPLNSKLSECNSVMGAVTVEKTGYVGINPNCERTHSPAEKSRVTLRDILRPLFPNLQTHSSSPSTPKASSSCKTLPASLENYSADRSNKIKDSNGKLLYICHITGCGKVFGYPHTLKRHLDLHSGEKNFVCPHCGRKFARKDSLTSHLKTHAKDFFCAYCDESFLSKNCLRLHVKRHMTKKLIDCQSLNSRAGDSNTICGSGQPLQLCHISHSGKYSYAKVITSHLQLHKGKTEFHCAHCDERFWRKDQLAKHVQVHMNFDETGPKNNNFNSQLAKFSEETDTSSEESADNIADSLNYNLQSSMEELLSPSRDIQVSKFNSVTEALTEKSTDYSEDSLDSITNGSLTDDKRVSIRDLLTPLSPNLQSQSIESETPSACEPENFTQDLQESIPSSKNLIKDMLSLEDEKLKSLENTDFKKMKDRRGFLRYICPIPNCGKTYKRVVQFKYHLDWHLGKYRFFCAHCNKGFVRKDALCFHVRMHMPRIKKRKTSECSNWSTKNYDRTEDADAKPRQLSHIANCPRVFKCDERPKKQMQSNENRKIFVCALCDLTFPSKGELIEHVVMHVIEKPTQSENRSFGDQITQNLSATPKAEAIHAECTADICNENTQPLAQDLMPCHVSSCYSIIDRAPEVKTDNFADSLTYMTGCLAEDSSQFYKTEYFVQESVSSLLNDHVLDCYPTVEELPRVKIEDPSNSPACITRSSSLVRNPFYTQFRQQLLSHKKEVHSNVQIQNQRLICKTEPYEQESMSLLPNGQISDFYPVTDKSVEVKTESFVDNVDMASISSFEQNQFSRQTLLSPLPCENEVHLTPHDEPYSKSNTSSTCEIQPYVDNLVSLEESDKTGAISPTKSLDNAISEVESCNAEGGNKTKDSNGDPQSARQIFNLERVHSSPCHLKRHVERQSGKKIFFCDQCDKGYFSDGKQIVQCPSCSVDVGNKTKDFNVEFQHACHMPNCNQVYSSSWHLKRHLEWHSNQKNYFCFHCNKGFVHKDVFHFHLRTAHSSDDDQVAQYQNCSPDETENSNDKSQQVCSYPSSRRVFEPVSTLTKNLEKDTSQENFSEAHTNVERSEFNDNSIESKVSEIPSIPTLQVPEKSEQTNRGAKVTEKSIDFSGNPKITRFYSCYYQSCDKVFDSTAVLQQHLEEHIGQKNWLCIYCDKKFLYKYELKAHIKTHTTVSKNCNVEYDLPNSQVVHDQSFSEQSRENENRLSDELMPQNSDASESARIPSVDESFENLRAILCNTHFCTDGDDCTCCKSDENNGGPQLYDDALPPEVSNEEIVCTSPSQNVIEQYQVPDVCQGEEILIEVSADNNVDNLISEQDFATTSQQSQVSECNLGIENFLELDLTFPVEGVVNVQDVTGHNQCQIIYKSIPDRTEPSTSEPLEVLIDDDNNILQLPESTLLKTTSKDFEYVILASVPDDQELDISAGVNTDHTTDSLLCSENFTLVEEIEVDTQNPRTQDLANMSYPNESHSISSNSSDQPSHLEDHLVMQSSKKKFVCPYCRKRFSWKCNMELHLKIHMPGHIKRRCQCSICSAEGDSETRGLSEKMQHVCYYPDCGKVFCEISNLKMHINRGHLRKKKFFCAYCNKRFAYKSTAMKHVQIHRNSKMPQKFKPTECQCPNCISEGGNKIKDSNGKLLHVCCITDCGRTFVDPTVLAKHLDTHSDEEIIVCPYCPARFAHRDIFMAHVRVHSNESSSISELQVSEKFELQTCQCATCKANDDSKGEFNHVCPVADCGRVFKKASSLNMHQRWHLIWDSGRKYFCDFCNKGFYSKDHLNVHVEIHMKFKRKRHKISNMDNQVSQELLNPKMKSSREHKLTDCQSQNRCTEDGNHTNDISRSRYVYNIFNRKGINKGPRHFKTQLNYHAKGYKQNEPEMYSVGSPILQSDCSLMSESKAEILCDDVKPQHFCTVAGCYKIYYSAKGLSAHLKSHSGDHSYNIPRLLQSHSSHTDSYSPECDESK